MWQVESCRQSCNHGIAYSRCNTFHLVLRACKQAASVPFAAPDCLFVRDDGCYFGLASLNDWPSVIRQRITAAQSRPSQIETHVNKTAAGVCVSLGEASTNEAKRHFPPSVPAHRRTARPLSPTTFWCWNRLQCFARDVSPVQGQAGRH